MSFSGSYSGSHGDSIVAGANSRLSFSGLRTGSAQYQTASSYYQYDPMGGGMPGFGGGHMVYIPAYIVSGTGDTIRAGDGSELSFSGTLSGTYSTIEVGANAALAFTGSLSGQQDVILLGNNDLLSITYASLLATDTITGGSNDTLQILNADTINDSVFANDTFTGGIVSLGDSGGSSSISLGSAAQAAGITSAIAGSGNDTLDLSSWNASGQHAGFTLTGGSGADNFVLGNGSGNAFGNMGSDIATINHFTASDTLSLHIENDYTFQSGTFGAGGAYNTELLAGSNVVAYIDDQSYGLASSSSMSHVNLIGSPPA
jgi:hypothetical protein